jgi:cellulose synthase/poly-beta-1,6-N-acetylglucosamine synthase-like glycosyltransferase
VRKWSGEIHKAIFTHVVLIGIPTIFFYSLRQGGWSLTGLHLAIATFYLFSAFMLLLESAAAMFRRFATTDYKRDPSRLNQTYYAAKEAVGIGGARRPYPWRPVPKCSFLVAAYLPNEQDIILETLEHVLINVERPGGGLEVILAYNTPISLPVEQELETLAQLYPELRLLRVEDSRSKAENLNAAFELVTGEITCILDADHHPAADCFFRAWHWISQGYDVVQGRSIIRNHERNWLTQTVAIEFEMMYGIIHAAKSFLTDSSIFGGSNGYWRTSVLKQTEFCTTAVLLAPSWPQSICTRFGSSASVGLKAGWKLASSISRACCVPTSSTCCKKYSGLTCSTTASFIRWWRSRLFHWCSVSR